MARITRIGASTFPFIREIRGQSDLGFDSRDAQNGNASTEERRSSRCGAVWLRFDRSVFFCAFLRMYSDVSRAVRAGSPK